LLTLTAISLPATAKPEGTEAPQDFCERRPDLAQQDDQHTDGPPAVSDLIHQNTYARPQQHTASSLNWRPVPPSLASSAEVPSHINADTLALCGGYYEPPRLEQLPEGEPENSGRLFGWAYRYRYDSTGLATLCGDVLLRKDDLQVRSNTVQLNEQTQTATLSGEVTLTTADSILRGDTARIHLDSNRTQLSNAEFLMFNQGARGSAKEIITESSSQTQIIRGEYTTCPPGNDDWRLTGRHFDLNHDTGWGELWHMRLKLGRVPVFYAPYFRFPLDDARHTGLLYPEFNNLSEPDIALPFYWNLAPNYDWLIKPRKIGGRGTMIESQFRYLNVTGKGELDAALLREDRQFNNEDRKNGRWRHQGTLLNHWYWSADAGYVSDNEYLDDLGANLEAISASFIPRSLLLEGGIGAWNASARLQSFQTIDAAISDADQPYRKLPEITVSHTYGLLDHRIEWRNTVSYSYLAQPLAAVAPFAHRTHWITELAAPMQASWHFFTPSLRMQGSYYDLSGSTDSGAPSNNNNDNRGRRYVPTFSLGAGLFFDRPLQIFNKPWVQTLEPRIFYAYTPFRDQSWLPVFDTTALTFGFDQLFRSDRFTGIDRIGDTNQTTLAVTTRLMDHNRIERAKLTVGQILFHEDRAVTLPGEVMLTGTQSPLLFRAESKLPWAVNFSGGMTWDTGQNILEDGNLQLTRMHNRDRSWQTSYRYRKTTLNNDRIEQVSFGTRQRLKGFWHLVAALQFDVENTNTLEQVSGFQYEDCCWRADLVYHRRIRSNNDLSDDAENRYAFLLQFELKGLGGVGSRLETLLRSTIPGY
jgi:LPS-assembly protein